MLDDYELNIFKLQYLLNLNIITKLKILRFQKKNKKSSHI